MVSPKSSKAAAALRALKSAFGREPVLLREGGSIPIVTEFKKILRADSLMLGLALAFGLGGKDLAKRYLERRFAREPSEEQRENEDELSPL